MDIKIAVQQIINDRKEAYRAHREKIEERAKELNFGWVMCAYNKTAIKKAVAPTWGKDDRPHAPYDGYLWEDPRTGNIDAYGGGQYLPYTDEWDDILGNTAMNDFSGLGAWKMRLTEETYDSLKAIQEICMEEPYKSWKLEDGTQVFMVKMKAGREILEMIQEYSEKEFQKIYDFLKTLKGDAPSGKVMVNGTIRSTKMVEGMYGYGFKMTVVLRNGATVYGSLPSGVNPDYRGEISFKATFEVAKDDKTHAFFKRPSSVITEEV